MAEDPKGIDPETLQKIMADGGALVVDVRETNEYEEEHIPGTLLYPLSFLDADLFPKITEKKVIMVCQVGKRSAAAAKQLMAEGIADVANLEGGLVAWLEQGLETEGAKFEEDFGEGK